MSKMNMSTSAKKLIASLTVGVIVVVGVVYFVTRRPAVVYQYDQVKSGRITATVNVSGVVKAADSLDLSFERSGKINKKYVAVGDQVKAGQPLLSLDNSDAAAQLAQAQAALNQKIAGVSPAAIAQLAAAVQQAQASVQQVAALSDSSNSAAAAAEATAENNLKLAQGGGSSQIVDDAYANLSNLLQSAQNTLADALTKADDILGVDDTVANSAFRDVLSLNDLSRLAAAKDSYAQAKTAEQAFLQADSQADNAASTANHATLDAAAARASDALSATRGLLSGVTAVLDNTAPSQTLNAAALDGLKSNIQAGRSEVAGQIAAVTAQQQVIATSLNSYDTYQIAFNQAQQNLKDTTSKTAADQAAAQAALARAQAALADAQNPPRAVDLGTYRAAVLAAQVYYDKAVLTAPFDGTISRQDGELGQLAVPNVPLVSLISDSKYQAQIYVAETDLPKIKVGDAATVTLDNLDPGQQFAATVLTINPSATTLPDGSSAYQVTLQFANNDSRLQVGLTANVSIVGAAQDGALIIPAHDVVQTDGAYSVMVLPAGQTDPQQAAVTIGLKGDNDQWAVTSGLSAGDSVISFDSAQSSLK